jgi:hypothetical protein
VLTVAESRDYGRPIYINNTVNLDGKQVAKNQVKHIPGQLANAGL